MSSTSHYPAAPASQSIERRTLSVIVDNEPGVLARVIGLFSGRGYNIDSLTVSETEHEKHLSRITVVTRGTPMVIEQIKNQLDRLVPVHRVVDMTTAGPAIERELAHLAAHWPARLPDGVVHADLFPDNVFFVGDQVSGVIDFYFACNDFLAYDIAVCLNDWCIDLPSGAHDAARSDAFLAAYQAVRPLTTAERQLLPALLRAGALRFWISRLWDLHLPRDAAMLKAHDPAHFERVLRARLAFKTGIS